MTIIQRTVCMIRGHDFTSFRKVPRQWRKARTCNRCGYADYQTLTPSERKPYEERTRRDNEAKRKTAKARQADQQQQRQSGKTDAKSTASNAELCKVSSIAATHDGRTENSDPPAAA